MEDKKNLDLRALAEELERQAGAKEDRVVSSDNIYTFVDNKTNTVRIGLLDEKQGKKETIKTSDITEGAHRHLSTKLGINWPYYTKMKDEKPELLTTNINTWLSDDGNKRRLMRYLNGELRAVLSNRFKIIDNDIVWNHAQKELINIAKESDMKIDVRRADLTNDHMYVKITSPDLVDEINPNKEKKAGDKINGGIIIKNSETGHGRFDAIPFILVLRCTNGLIGEDRFSRTHLGRKLDDGLIEWSEETRIKNLEATMSEFKDAVRQTFNRETFSTWVVKINKDSSEELEEPTIAVNNIVKKYNLAKESNDLLLKYLMKEEASDTKWGLSMAVTTAAQDTAIAPKYEDQIRLERAGREILDTPMKQIVRGF